MQGGDSCLVTSRNPPAGKEKEACPPVSGTAGVRGDVDRAPTPGRQQVGGPKLEYVVLVPLAAGEPGRRSSDQDFAKRAGYAKRVCKGAIRAW